MSSTKPSPPARKQSLNEGSPSHSAKDVKEIKEVAKKGNTNIVFFINYEDFWS